MVRIHQQRWEHGGAQSTEAPTATELLVEWMNPFINEADQNRLVDWILGVSLSLDWGLGTAHLRCVIDGFNPDG